jgi:hypothetical protein
MSFDKSLQFIDRVRHDPAFRKEGYQAKNFRRWMIDAGYDPGCGEIWDAFRNLLLKVADEYGANEIKEIRQWYMLLSGEDEDQTNCGSCAAKENCTVNNG